MKIARFWRRATASLQGEEVHAWGWSSSSERDAQQNAEQVVGRLVQWLGNRPNAEPLWRYGYDGRPPREEIVQEFHDDTGEVNAIVTRNPYGVLVLITRDLVFIDADIPYAPPSIGDLVPKFLRGLFGKPAQEESQATPEEETLEKICDWSAANPQVGLRVYRTAAGFRLMVTSHAIEATTPEADGLLAALPTDTLYRQLCRSQECYRARLTPKPWRIGARAPTQRYPWSDSVEEQAFHQWLTDYENRAAAFSTCRLVEWLGPQDMLPELAPLIDLHDQITRCESEASLA